MSIKRTISVSCPFCDNHQLATIWDSINGTDDPKLKRNLLNQSVNKFICNRCRKTSEIRVNILYHDMQRNFMIWLRYPDENGITISTDPELKKIQPLLDMNQPYLLRQVTSLNQLIEKIRIFDHNLDDQSIELVKLTILANYNEKDIPSEDRIIFKKLHTTLFRPAELLFLLINSSYAQSQEYFVKYSVYLSIYDKLQTIIINDTESKTDWMWIDREFAIRIATIINSDKSDPLKEFSISNKPDGTAIWKDEDGNIHENHYQPNELKDLLRKSGAKQVFRILIKDPASSKILEDYWQLTPSQVENFVDENSTAYCMVVYEKDKRKQYLIKKNEWLKIQGYS
ncbi:MAG: CpXC domain-containing protein [Bacteroidales bacterium]|nr:CpXC domain-containing protein [Bacteroidales bacterium]